MNTNANTLITASSVKEIPVSLNNAELFTGMCVKTHGKHLKILTQIHQQPLSHIPSQ